LTFDGVPVAATSRWLFFGLVAQSARPAFAHPISSLDVDVDTANIKNGMTIEIDKEPYKVISFSIMKQARGDAKATIKFKNLMRGTTIENTYSTDRVRNSKRP
jgi:hypothetical protein